MCCSDNTPLAPKDCTAGRSLWAWPSFAAFPGGWPALTAVVVMATIPVLVLYIFFQRYFTAGLAASGVKG